MAFAQSVLVSVQISGFEERVQWVSRSLRMMGLHRTLDCLGHAISSTFPP